MSKDEKNKRLNIGSKVKTPKHGEGVVTGFSKSIDKNKQEYTVVHVKTKTGTRNFALDELK